MTKWTAKVGYVGCLAGLVVLPSAEAGCAVQNGTSEANDVGINTSINDSTAIVARRTTVEVDGCALDSWQSEALASTAMRKVVQEVVLMCLVPREDGSVGPTDPSARTALEATTAVLHGYGYRVSLGISFTDETGERFDGVQTASWLSNAGWIGQVTQGVMSHQAEADGFDLDLERLPDSAEKNVTDLVTSLSMAVRPKSSLGIFVLPSTMIPSDIVGGRAFDLTGLSAVVDRIRVATLDFSIGSPGPTIDSGWAVDALRLAQMSTGSVPVDIAAPLYGWDFIGGTQRSVMFDEAVGLAREYGASVSRTPGGEPNFSYTDTDGQSHVLFYDDAQSTLITLGAWNASTLPATVGLVLWGFGAEDPSLWSALASAENRGQK